MTGIHHQLAIRAPIAQVYAALSEPERIGTWWDRQTAVQADAGLVLEHDPGEQHGIVRLKVLQRLPNQRVEWECISEHPPTSPASAWTGTHFVFELSEGPSAAADIERDCADDDAKNPSIVTLDFRQTHYDLASPFAGFNNFAWGQVLANLKHVCESRQE
jgi:uncharacterized protein YndB with AHSA1/START domain